MKLLILVSCFCLQLASAPAAKAICLDGPASLKAPDSGSVEPFAATTPLFEASAREPLYYPAPDSELPAERFPFFTSAKNYLIHTGLSPPFVIG